MRGLQLPIRSAARFWPGLRQPLKPAPSGEPACVHARGIWRRLRGRPQPVLLEGARYCAERCLDGALGAALGKLRPVPPPPATNHRVPLGLLLLQREEVKADQLRLALASQRAAGQGKIGEWLQHLGFASAQQITGALAQQWSCPVLRAASPKTWRIPRLPTSLLESFGMLPVDYAPRSATLHIAFGERIDYTVLYAMGQMLGCRTEPCLVTPGWLRQKLDNLAEQRREGEIVFDGAHDLAEFARNIRGYCQLTGVVEVRLARCGGHLWARLLAPETPVLDLILRLPFQRPALAPPARLKSLSAPADRNLSGG